MKKIGMFLLVLVVGVVAISAILNISRQFSTLIEAKNKNQQMGNSIAKLKETNKKIIKQIEYATSSAYLEQEARDKFGLGTENDAWIILGPEQKSDSIPVLNVGDLKPKYQQWLDLFTR